MSTLCDRISEHKNRYSFAHENTNGLDSKYTELSERICADPVHSLMTYNGWKERAVKRFLKKEEELLGYIMAMMYLRSGQAPRATEFFSILRWNSASLSRGFHVYEGSMMYVTRHSKARRTTNQAFQVARYLSIPGFRHSGHILNIHPSSHGHNSSLSKILIERVRNLLRPALST
jgi:hypothetical protein